MSSILKLVLGLVLGALMAAGGDVAKVVNVLMPEIYHEPDAPARTARYPMGSTPCDSAIRSVFDTATGCLYDSQTDMPNDYYCQDPYGCRQTLIRTIYHMSSVCSMNEDLFPNISNLMQQITYATSKACPTSPYSCDLQSSLVLAMQKLWMNDTAVRPYQCSPCVKQSFGRHNEVSGKARCNKLGELYCPVDGSDLIARDNLCRPCTQRYWAKTLSAAVIKGVENNAAQFLRACYDDGDDHPCYSKVAAHLEEIHNVVIGNDGVFKDLGDFKACGHANACTDPACLQVVEALVDGVGCCAPAVPVHLLLNFGLPCLEPMIEQKVGLDASCNPLATAFIQITVAARDSAENVCAAVRQDLATTLAVLPELVRCEGVANANPGQVTVRASIFGLRATGTVTSVPFDPDQLQYPVLDIKTSAIA